MDNYFKASDILDKAIGTDAYFQIKSILLGTKTADVAPVRHGRWIDSSNGWMCSECKQDNTYDKPWCPNCGAKMDAKEDEDAEPVVHCVDCIYLMFSDFYGECKRGYLGGVVKPDDYCSRGIRKEDNT